MDDIISLYIKNIIKPLEDLMYEMYRANIKDKKKLNEISFLYYEKLLELERLLAEI